MARRLTPLLLVALACVLSLGCSQSAEARRKEAQANADKYLEFLKANDAEGAYKHTFGQTYKSQQSLESWIRFRQGMSNTTGPILNYQVVKYDATPTNPRVSLTYAIQTANVKDPILETVRLEREGTEWKIVSVEPQMSTQQTPPHTGGTQLPIPPAEPANK